MDIYKEIQQKLDTSQNYEQLKEAYNWLSELYKETNEGAKNFEKRVEEKYGKESLEELIFGSKWLKKEYNRISKDIMNTPISERTQTLRTAFNENENSIILEDFYNKLSKASSLNEEALVEINSMKDMVSLMKETKEENER